MSGTTSEEIKEKILSVAVARPASTARAVRRMLTRPDAEDALAAACAAIGFDFARQVFDGIPGSRWREWELRAAAGRGPRATAAALESVYLALLGDALSPGTSGDPFEFLREMSESGFLATVSGAEPERLALISLHWPEEELSRLFGALSREAGRRLVLAIHRLRRLPPEVAEQAAARFARELEASARGPWTEVPVRLPESEREANEAVERLAAIIEERLRADEALIAFVSRETPDSPAETLLPEAERSEIREGVSRIRASAAGTTSPPVSDLTQVIPKR